MRRGDYSLAVLLVLAAFRAASAAPPSIQAAESSVQLGLTAGYGAFEENRAAKDTEAGGVIGVAMGASSLSPIALNQLGWPDLYASVSYRFSAGLLRIQDNTPDAERSSGGGAGYANMVMVRLGLGEAFTGAAEIIPYSAGGYQTWTRGQDEAYQAGLLGGGIKLDVAATPLLVVSADAEGFAVIAGKLSVPAQNYTGGFGPSAEERISLGADYRINNAWHAFAGLGVTYYGYSGSRGDIVQSYDPLGTNLQINSMFGLSYGF